MNHSFRGLHHQPAPFPVQRDALVSDLADQEHRLAHRLVQGLGQLVLSQGLLNGLAHLRFHAKKTVRGNAAFDALVGTEVVVVGDEMGEAILGLGEFLRLDPPPEFLAHRLPETLTFAQRLGMVGAGDHVADALLFQQPLEVAFPAPGEILSPLVGQDFQGFAPTLDTFQ